MANGKLYEALGDNKVRAYNPFGHYSAPKALGGKQFATMATGDAGRGNPSRADAGTRGRRNSGGEVDRDEAFDAVEDLLMAVDATTPAGNEKSR
jgi:hypothetical protein